MPPPELMLSIVIVNWNSWEYLNRCLFSIREFAGGLQYEIIVVDNGSSDGSPSKTRDLFPEVNLIALKENVGFPKANNLGFSVSQGKYLLVLNPDTEIRENTLQHSLDFLEHHPDYGCVGVKTRKGSGGIQFSCARKFPTFRGIVYQILFLDKIFPKLTSSENIDMTFWDHEDSRDVDMIAGSYMMFPVSLYEKIGGFDERIPMFLEDVEYCKRIWNSGYKIRYLGDVEIVHHVGKSTAKAVPEWIARLRYEVHYFWLKDFSGDLKANQFLYILIMLLPIKLMYLPLLCLWFFLKNHENRFKLYFSETITGLKWSINKIRKKSMLENSYKIG